jgi:apolipoprotein D and lipocalin family protein
MRLALFLGWCLLIATFPARAESLTPITALDVPRYMGVWYEVAKFPNWFQRKCVSDTQAEYRLLDNGRIQVTNRCRKSNAEWMQAEGEARQIGPSNSAQLQVRFAPSWLAALPFVWGNYWVIDLDTGYELVAVSEPGKEYLWILARQPQVSADAYDALLQRLAAQGLDVARLERTPHSPSIR